MKFKVGDTVFYHNRDDHRFIVSSEGVYTGRRLPDKSKEVLYVLDNLDYGNNQCAKEFRCSEHYLTQRKIANTPITRKLYPHYKEDGEWLLVTEKNT